MKSSWVDCLIDALTPFDVLFLSRTRHSRRLKDDRANSESDGACPISYCRTKGTRELKGSDDEWPRRTTEIHDASAAAGRSHRAREWRRRAIDPRRLLCILRFKLFDYWGLRVVVVESLPEV